jgi:hypothetical protein
LLAGDVGEPMPAICPSRMLCRDAQFVLAIACFLFGPLVAHSQSSSTKCMNNLRQIAFALNNYKQTLGALPTDILDAKGRPILSWRVRLLPFLEQCNLYGLFHLDEPWDSPHNWKIAYAEHGYPPQTYLCPSYSDSDLGKTVYLIPRGPGTVLPPGPAEKWRTVPGDGSATIVIVEAAPEHAVFWSKPSDLPYNPATPQQGLGRYHFPPFGTMTVLGNGEVRLLPNDLNADVLRSLFAVDGAKPDRIWLTWYEMLGEPAFRKIMLPVLLVRLCGTLGLVWVCCRLLRGKSASPGELLAMVTGAQQSVSLLAVLALYRQQLLPSLGSNDDQLLWWLFPDLAGVVAAGSAWAASGRWGWWRFLFFVLFFLLLLATLDAATPYPKRQPRESLTTAGTPIILGVAALVSAYVSRLGAPDSASARRRLFHWAGIYISSLPFLLLIYGMALGWAWPCEDWFVRIRE